MFANANDSQKGMDIYESDGEKIGSVAETPSDVTDDTSVGGAASNDVLGDDSRVVGGRGTGGGPGTLGDDTRVVGGHGTGGGAGTLGDDTRVTGG